VRDQSSELVGHILTDTTGVNVNWAWSAAVYTNFNADLSMLGYKN
jgi:hypothetical protein